MNPVGRPSRKTCSQMASQLINMQGGEKSSRRTNTRTAVTSLAVASIEWYDFFIYGTAAALVFPAVFFPSQDKIIGTLLSFATFGVAFVARPIGGVIFGHLGDTLGRRKALVSALAIMGVVTTGIGFLPSFATIGIAAPILLASLRFVQGIAVGGQQGGVVVLSTENIPPERRGFFGSFTSAGCPAGTILANLVFVIVLAAVPGPAFDSWGWRLPFFINAPLIILGIILQLRMHDTSEFKNKAKSLDTKGPRSPVLVTLVKYPKQVLLSAGCFMAINLNYYMFITFVVAYATNPEMLGLSKTTVLTSVLIASGVQMLMIPFTGYLSDRWGRRRVFSAGAILLGLWAFAFWPLINTKSELALIAGLIVGLGLLHSLMYGPQPAMFSESFSPEVRYSGVSIGMQIGAVLGGGVGPLIATALFATYKSSTPIAFYMAIACGITFCCGILLTSRKMQGNRTEDLITIPSIQSLKK